MRCWSIIPALLSGEMTEHHGKFYDIPPVKISPGTGKALPIMISRYAPAAMRKDCRFDGWIFTSHEENDIYPQLDSLNTVRC